MKKLFFGRLVQVMQVNTRLKLKNRGPLPVVLPHIDLLWFNYSLDILSQRISPIMSFENFNSEKLQFGASF